MNLSKFKLSKYSVIGDGICFNPTGDYVREKDCGKGYKAYYMINDSGERIVMGKTRLWKLIKYGDLSDCDEELIDLACIGFPNYSITKSGKVWSQGSELWLSTAIDNTVCLAVRPQVYKRISTKVLSKNLFEKRFVECDDYKRIPDHPEYFAHSSGKIWSLHSAKWLRPALRKDGYLDVKLNGKSILLHRIIAKLFVDNPDNKPEVNHNDGVKTNCDKSNLEWCTRSENMKHAVSLGLVMPPIHKR